MKKVINIIVAEPLTKCDQFCEMIDGTLSSKTIDIITLVREEVSSKSDFGLKIKKIVDCGAVIPQDYLLKLIGNSLSKMSGIINVKGYPRDSNQFSSFQEYLNNNNAVIGNFWYLQHYDIEYSAKYYFKNYKSEYDSEDVVSIDSIKDNISSLIAPFRTQIADLNKMIKIDRITTNPEDNFNEDINLINKIKKPNTV